MRRMMRAVAIALALVSLLPESALAKRVALVIANSRYVAASPLANPGNDARLIAAALKKSGFDAVDLKVDLGKVALEEALRSFGNTAEGADVALVYYAGHGIEAGGQNYLIPVDAKLERDRDLDIEGTRLDTALLMSEGARMRIVVLDACRNNPFATRMIRTMKTRSIGRGLAAIEPEGETLVVYAAKAGATAADGEGANSPFAVALARRLPEPGLEISLLFRTVRDDVLKATGRTQEPFTYGSLSGNAFYFVPAKGGKALAGGSGAGTTVATGVSRETTESLFWQGALTANTEPAFRAYIKRYPSGTFAELAEQNLARIAAKPVAPPKPPPAAGSGPLAGAAALPNLAAAFTAPTGMVSPSAGAGAVQRFAFRPDPTRRRANIAKFIGELRQTNALLADIIEAEMASKDFFAIVNAEVAKYGMTTDNLADATTVFIDTMRAATLPVDEPDATRQQAQKVREQMALVLLATPETADLGEAGRQDRADAMILTAIFIGVTREAAKLQGPQGLKKYADDFSALSKAQLGIDLRAIRITNEGYRM